jgi:hypothetical protein
MYGRRLTPLRVRAVLEAIERNKRQRFHETEHLNADLSVEHVLPTKWEKHWPLPDGERPTYDETLQAMLATEENDTRIGQIVRRHRLLDTFGNLTILTKPLNSSVSHGPYDVKRKALNDHSLLVLNREIVKEEEWGEAQIEARGRKLFEVARKLWPYPQTERAAKIAELQKAVDEGLESGISDRPIKDVVGEARASAKREHGV